MHAYGVFGSCVVPATGLQAIISGTNCVGVWPLARQTCSDAACKLCTAWFEQGLWWEAADVLRRQHHRLWNNPVLRRCDVLVLCLLPMPLGQRVFECLAVVLVCGPCPDKRVLMQHANGAGHVLSRVGCKGIEDVQSGH